MIEVYSLPQAYRGAVRNKTGEVIADAPISKGGGGRGIGAHELLEASLAACLNMAVRMHARQHGIPLDHVSTTVSLSKPDPQTSRIEYSMALAGSLTTEQRAELQAVAELCPVRQTHTRRLEFAAVTS